MALPIRSNEPLPGRAWVYEPLPSAKRFHELRTRYKGFSGAIGSGKSYAFSYEALFSAYANAGLWGLIGAPTYPMLRDSTQRTFFEVLEIENIGYSYHKADNRLVIDDTGSTILFRSMDVFERLRGTNLAWFGIDELTYAPPEAWSRLEGRLREHRALRLCGFGSWTPKGFDHVYDKFIANPKPGYAAIRATPRENKYLAAGFYDSLATSYDPKFYEQEVLGAYLSLVSGVVYHAFVREENVAPVDYDPTLALCWALDFNVNPMSSVLVQVSDSTTYMDRISGFRRVNARVIDEIVIPNSNTPECVNVFIDKARRLAANRAIRVNVYGDPAGSARQTTGESDWQIVRNALARCSDFEVSYDIPSSHPRVKDRVNAVNAMLCTQTGERRLLINPRCKELIKDMERVVWKEDAHGNSTGEISDTDHERTHTSSALGYLIEREFGIKQSIGFRQERIF